MRQKFIPSKFSNSLSRFSYEKRPDYVPLDHEYWKWYFSFLPSNVTTKGFNVKQAIKNYVDRYTIGVTGGFVDEGF